MSDNKVTMPSSQGGLLRYFDEGKPRFRMSPTVVVIMCMIVIILGIVLNNLV